MGIESYSVMCGGGSFVQHFRLFCGFQAIMRGLYIIFMLYRLYYKNIRMNLGPACEIPVSVAPARLSVDRCAAGPVRTHVRIR